MGVFMYSETCIRWSPSGDGVPQNRKKMPFYDVTDHLINKNSLKLLQTSISGENYGLNFTKKIILSFNGVLLIDVIVHYRWKTIKGDHDHLIEMSMK